MLSLDIITEFFPSCKKVSWCNPCEGFYDYYTSSFSFTGKIVYPTDKHRLNYSSDPKIIEEISMLYVHHVN